MASRHEFGYIKKLMAGRYTPNLLIRLRVARQAKNVLARILLCRTATFWARSKDKAGGNRPEPFSLQGTEFVRRWTMHILPQGFMRSRSYGGYHSTKRGDYLDACRQLLGLADEGPPSGADRPDESKPSGPKCPQCETVMEFGTHRKAACSGGAPGTD